MRTFIKSLLPVLFVFTLVGCDSNDDDDDNVFVGSWGVVSISDIKGDLTADFALAVTSFSITFDDGDGFDLLVEFTQADGRGTLPLSGTYQVNETLSTLVLNGTFNGLPINLIFEFDVVNNDEIDLMADALAINLLFDTDYQDVVTLTVARQ